MKMKLNRYVKGRFGTGTWLTSQPNKRLHPTIAFVTPRACDKPHQPHSLVKLKLGDFVLFLCADGGVMKKLIYAILGGIVLLLLVFLLDPRYTAKRDALVSVGQLLVNSKAHQVVVVEGGVRVFTAQYNFAVIERAINYMGTLGSGTSVYRDIARIASEADRECERFEAVLDLAVRSTSNSQRVLALAESVCRIDSPEDEAIWQAAYDSMLEMAEFPSVEVAVASQKMH